MKTPSGALEQYPKDLPLQCYPLPRGKSWLQELDRYTSPIDNGVRRRYTGMIRFLAKQITPGYQFRFFVQYQYLEGVGQLHETEWFTTHRSSWTSVWTHFPSPTQYTHEQRYRFVDGFRTHNKTVEHLFTIYERDIDAPEDLWSEAVDIMLADTFFRMR